MYGALQDVSYNHAGWPGWYGVGVIHGLPEFERQHGLMSPWPMVCRIAHAG